MTNSILVNKIYDAVCETVGRGKTAAAGVRQLLETGDHASIAAVADKIRDCGGENQKARMCVLRVTLKRACKALEIAPLGVKLNKETGKHYLSELEQSATPEVDEVAKALEIVLENLDREDVLGAIVAALQAKSGT